LDQTDKTLARELAATLDLKLSKALCRIGDKVETAVIDRFV
jgi:hypothetical protein